MAIRDKMTANVQSHLAPGETVQAVFGAQTMNQWYLVVAILFCLIPAVVLMFTNQYLVVAATDRRILVCRSGKHTTTKADSIMRELPRQTRIGPAGGLWFECHSLGEKMFVHKRFHKDIAAADAAIGAAA